MQEIKEQVREGSRRVVKREWKAVGYEIRERERGTTIVGDKWISLRLDGNKFSKFMRKLRRDGVIQAGFDPQIGDIMVECTRKVMEEFNGAYGYTQSDEMTILLAPKEKDVHIYGGKRAKLCSLAAATVSSLFNLRLGHGTLARFDCRVGYYDTMEEAAAVILWRAYDCRINGVHDAVRQQKIPGAKAVAQKHTGVCLEWLQEKGLLPLPAHQEFGTLLVRGRRTVTVAHYKTGEPTEVERRCIDHVPGDVMELVKSGTVFA